MVTLFRIFLKNNSNVKLTSYRGWLLWGVGRRAAKGVEQRRHPLLGVSKLIKLIAQTQEEWQNGL